MRVGIDEAGKGPVLGPMVAAAVGVPEPAVLPDGVADSKQLAAERREAIAERLRSDDRVAIGVATVGVERIDAPDTDMNSLTVAAQAAALDAVRGRPAGGGGAPERTDGGAGGEAGGGAGGEAGGGAGAGSGRTGDDAVVSGDPSRGGDSEGCTVLADAGDTSAERFARRLAGSCAGEPSVGARHGADESDPVVAAASVVAKVERDARVDGIAAEYGEVGSGYPSDPATRRFLASFVDEHGELPACARESWQTCSDVLAAAAQSGLDEF